MLCLLYDAWNQQQAHYAPDRLASPSSLHQANAQRLPAHLVTTGRSPGLRHRPCRPLRGIVVQWRMSSHHAAASLLLGAMLLHRWQDRDALDETEVNLEAMWPLEKVTETVTGGQCLDSAQSARPLLERTS